MTASTLNIADIVEQALSMPRPERSYIAERLLVSLDDADEMARGDGRTGATSRAG